MVNGDKWKMVYYFINGFWKFKIGFFNSIGLKLKIIFYDWILIITYQVVYDIHDIHYILV